jgi:hypothetical protein
METVRSTINNANRTVRNVGMAAGVAANEMPRLNDNVSAGAGAFDVQAGVMNNYVSAGVGAFDVQAGELYNNMSAGVDTVANGIDMLNLQGESLIMTADAAVAEVQRAVDSVEVSSTIVSDVIELLTPGIKVFVDLLGPHQYVVAANHFFSILQVLGALPDQNKRLFKLLNGTNTILQDMTLAYLEVESPRIVKNITRSSLIFSKETNKLRAFFFYSTNNIVIKQLQGLQYFAYDSFAELMRKVYVWNAFQEYTAQFSASEFPRRHTIIYFLDPGPLSQVLPHMEFTSIHQSVTIVNHYQAKQRLTMESIKVREGCFLTREHFSVCKIEATLGG